MRHHKEVRKIEINFLSSSRIGTERVKIKHKLTKTYNKLMLQYVNCMCTIETEFTKLKVKYHVEGQHLKHWKVRSERLKIHSTKLGNNFVPVTKDLGSQILGTFWRLLLYKILSCAAQWGWGGGGGRQGWCMVPISK